MSSMENLPNSKKGTEVYTVWCKWGQSTGVIEAMEQVLSLVEKARSFHSHKTLATDVEKADTREVQDCKALDAGVQRLWKEGAL